mmetsp:Transcript_70694/g.143572  ORF Transcript_70694/g.143572 Transcript_70694/m.143572 type:complete len:86 (-) Transcript_70694:223-480(-)
MAWLCYQLDNLYGAQMSASIMIRQTSLPFSSSSKANSLQFLCANRRHFLQIYLKRGDQTLSIAILIDTQNIPAILRSHASVETAR